MRYMDMEKFKIRSNLIHLVRVFFLERDFLEVDTPIRIPAPAPELHIDAVKSEGWYLQTSPELCMKELLSRGLKNIFQISKCFRKGERGDKHLPELTLLEWYCAGKDYYFLMEQTEDLFRYLCYELYNCSTLNYRKSEIDLKGPFERITVSDAFERFGSISMIEALRSDRFDEVMALEIEPKLGFEKPVFLYDYPKEMGALARKREDNPDVAERFELYIAGLELCNAFSELTNADEQRKRFEDEMKARKDLGKEVYPMAEKFLSILPDMPEAAGIALGIDRLIMLFTDSASIEDVTYILPEEL